jgi:hypothetical protein
METFGKLKLSDCLPMLKQIAHEHELKLHYVKDFKYAVFIMKCRLFTSC